MKRLRVAGFHVQPRLMWDDGEELTPGPAMGSVELSPSGLAEFAATWPEQFEAYKAQLAAAEASDPA